MCRQPFLLRHPLTAGLALAAVLSSLLAGCGGGGSTGSLNSTPPPAITISVAPTTATVRLQSSQTFTATVMNGKSNAVRWAIQELAAGGSITPEGIYTAPGTMGVYHIVASSVEDPSKTALAIVTVPVNLTVQVPSPTLSVRQSQTLTASVVGSSNKNVTWSVQEGASGGTITPGGVYTAPGLAGTYHIVTTSVADPTQSIISTITVQSSSASGTIQ